MAGDPDRDCIEEALAIRSKEKEANFVIGTDLGGEGFSADWALLMELLCLDWGEVTPEFSLRQSPSFSNKDGNQVSRLYGGK